MEPLKKLSVVLDKYRFPLIIFALGLVLLLMPTGGSAGAPKDSETKLQEVLSSTKGVGEARVIISDNGVVVVCEGAQRASVRLDIIRSVMSYTGFPSDKVTILKMND